MLLQSRQVTMTTTKQSARGGGGAIWALHRFRCTHEQKKPPKHIQTAQARKVALGQTQTSQNKSTNENAKQWGTVRSNMSFHPQKRMYGTTNFVTHFFSPRRFQLLRKLPPTSGIGHTTPKESSAKKNLLRVRKESPVIDIQRFPQTFFFFNKWNHSQFSSSVSQRQHRE